MRYYTTLIFSTILLVTVGCSIFPTPKAHKIHYYSIGSPTSIPLNYNVQVLSVLSNGNNQQEILFTKSDTQIAVDGLNNWILTPNELVQRYLTLALSPTHPNTSKKHIQLSAKLLTFESNLKNKTTTIALLVTLSNGSTIHSEKLFCATKKVAGNTATAYANAMHETISDITKQIATEINNIR